MTNPHARFKNRAFTKAETLQGIPHASDNNLGCIVSILNRAPCFPVLLIRQFVLDLLAQVGPFFLELARAVWKRIFDASPPCVPGKLFLFLGCRRTVFFFDFFDQTYDFKIVFCLLLLAALFIKSAYRYDMIGSFCRVCRGLVFIRL